MDCCQSQGSTDSVLLPVTRFHRQWTVASRKVPQTVYCCRSQGSTDNGLLPVARFHRQCTVAGHKVPQTVYCCRSQGSTDNGLLPVARFHRQWTVASRKVPLTMVFHSELMVGMLFKVLHPCSIKEGKREQMVRAAMLTP